MRFVRKWSYACAAHVASVRNDNHEKRAVYYYGFFIIIGALVKGIIMLSIALLLGVLVPTIVVILTFGSLRMFAGGHHMDSYEKCLFVSAIFYLLTALIAKYTYIYWNSTSIIALISLTFIFGLYSIIRYAPKDNPNKRITEPDKIKMYKRLSAIYLLVWLIITSILANLNLYLFVICMCLAVIQELFSVTPAGYSLFEKIKIALDAKKPKTKQIIS